MACAIFVALLLAVYLSVYYLMLAPQEALQIRYTLEPDRPLEFLPTYRFDAPIISLTLEPAHQLDRRIRRDRWERHPAAGN